MEKDKTDMSERIRIMVVDDEESIREGAARILRRMGHEVITAPRGDAALKMLETEKVSVIFLDLKMPGMDGMEVFRRVRKMDESILVVIITGFATVETAIEALKGGAYDFIPKPFEPDHLRIVAGRAKEKLRLAYLEEERKKTLLDLDTEKSRVRTVIESLPNGLLVTNAKGQVALMNPAFEQQVCPDSECVLGDLIRDYVKDNDDFCDFVMDISQGKHMNPDEVPTCELALPDNRYFLARGRPVISDDGECLGAVINLADITAMRLLDQLKSEFVAKVSHELRSPLSTIHEQLAVVINDMVEEASDKGQHILSRAQEKTRGLISLIGDLLDLSRIESGVMGREAKPVALDELLKSITDFLKARADAKNQSLVFTSPESSLPPITADPVALDSIFGNLISNAINYTQDGGDIRVDIGPAEDPEAGPGIRVRVSDNGFGIDPKYHEKIFERFYRVKTDKTRFLTGTGLGLPIVKSLVDSMGGNITLDSETGWGTTFRVFLPFEVGSGK